MPESPWPRTTAHTVFQRRLMIATGFVIVVLLAAIGLVGSLTVHTLTVRSAASASATTAPGPALPDAHVGHGPARTLLITAI